MLRRDVEDWASSFPRRPTPSYSSNYQYQIRHAGLEEIQVRGGGEEIWVDGIRAEDGFLLEAKFIDKPERSPFVSGSQIPDFIRQRIIVRVEDEFYRYGAVINDPNTPVRGLEVITNEPRAVPLFQELLNRFNVPGRVALRN